MAGFLVGTEPDLLSPILAILAIPHPWRSKDPPIGCRVFVEFSCRTYRRHGHVSLESPSHSIVDTLGLSPVGRHTFEAIALVPEETLGACIPSVNTTMPPSSILSRVSRSCDIYRSRGNHGKRRNIRFLTIGMCFFEEPILKDWSVKRYGF